jgi:RND family efflux transporter MFP subunit
MEALWNAVKSLAIWQILFLVVVLFGSATAVYFVYADQTKAEPTELAENQQLIPIRYGDIVNQVSTNGNLAFPERDTLRFGIKGAVGEILVEEGQTVSVGQELARLDAPTIATLEEAVAQARVDLLNAEEALAELMEPATEVTMALEQAAAGEAIAAARYQVLLAQDALEVALDPVIPTLMDVEAQKERIAATELSLQTIQEEREDLLNPELPSHREIKAQEELIADARVKLQEAIDARDELLNRDLNPDYEMNLADALQKQADAEKELAAIEESLADLAPTQRELVEATQGRLKAQIALDEANQALEEFLDTHGSTLTNRRVEKQDLEDDLSAAQTTLVSLQDAYDRGTLGLASNIDRWQIYTVSLEEELEQVRFGIVSRVEELEAEVALAETALQEAIEDLAEVKQGPDPVERAALEARAKAIHANMEVVHRDLAELERPEVDPQELALKEAQIVLAEATVSQGLEDLAQLMEELDETPDSLELQLNTQQLELARVTLSQQQEDLAELLEERMTVPNPAEVALREQQIVLAQASLAQAEEDLAELLEEQAAPSDPLEVALAEQKIVAGKVRLTTAAEELAAAIITSPIAGYVAEVSVELGDNVEARAAIMEVVDPTIMEIDGIVDEIDVLLVEVGTSAEVNLDALPGVTLNGVVTEIADEAENQQGVITFPIRIRMQLPEGVRPRAGLSAVANIVLREERNVLLVPQQALYGSFDRPLVRVMTDGGVSEIPVELGSSDDFWVSVKAGVSEGDQIILEGAEVGASEFSFRNLRRATGGSLGGRTRGGVHR